MTQPAPDSPATRRRVAVFAGHCTDGVLPRQTLPYLAGLAKVAEDIVVVLDSDPAPDAARRLASLARHVVTGRHGGDDFESYKLGLAQAGAADLLDGADDLILCNDSCFGPVGSFGPMFATMQARELDFWGATDSHDTAWHLQSHFIVLTRKVFTSEPFAAFIDAVAPRDTPRDAFTAHEAKLAGILTEAGFRGGAMVENRLIPVHPNDPSLRDVMSMPLYGLERGLPLVRARSLRRAENNFDGVNRVLDWLARNAPDIHELACADFAVTRFTDAGAVAFSVVMPTYNRAFCLERAIDAVMAQTHRNFELIVVDDGSRDNTETVIAGRYGDAIAEGRLRYVRLPGNVGVCPARNIGVAHAHHPWIAYADSDNAMRPGFLTMFANAIVEHPAVDAFYARMIHVTSGTLVGRPFDAAALVTQNFIDLNVFVHRRSLAAKFGGFDPDLRRLVDWDLCIRYTRHRAPVYIPRVLVDYTDDESFERITMNESFLKANISVHAKYSPKPTVSTVILSYNHQKFITEAIESALAQSGPFQHEILLSDDGSDDGTARIMARYAAKHPRRIRNISSPDNVGISENYRRCFAAAAGNYIAVLEGDDYWEDPEKNVRQAGFLDAHPEAVMVFSRVELVMVDGKRMSLERQDGLAPLLSGADFAADPFLNPIVNFSCTMFRRDAVAHLPSAVYTPRLSEIALAFYLDRLGKIGFIDRAMSAYRNNPASVWSGAGKTAQLKQAIAVRQSALRVARPEYRGAIQRQIDASRRALDAISQAAQPAAAQ